MESIDNLDRALTAVPDEALSTEDAEAAEVNKDLINLYTGLKMTEDILMGTLKKHGLEKVDPTEQAEGGKAVKFDPRIHEATFQTKVEGKEDGDVFFTQSKGYTLNGRVLRVCWLASCHIRIRDINTVSRPPRWVSSRTHKALSS